MRCILTKRDGDVQVDTPNEEAETLTTCPQSLAVGVCQHAVHSVLVCLLHFAFKLRYYPPANCTLSSVSHHFVIAMVTCSLCIERCRGERT